MVWGTQPPQGIKNGTQCIKNGYRVEGFSGVIKSSRKRVVLSLGNGKYKLEFLDSTGNVVHQLEPELI